MVKMRTNYKEQAIGMCADKSPAEIMSIICESKINNAHPSLIRYLQQILDASMKISITRTETILSAWTNYCRTSWIYRLFERIGLR